ncbi:MAG TPA: L,D-transpeptidase [Polyangiaceae bacterium]|nr:L,D-transpeptidase [Polyangiaceae bacterium]
MRSLASKVRHASAAAGIAPIALAAGLASIALAAGCADRGGAAKKERRTPLASVVPSDPSRAEGDKIAALSLQTVIYDKPDRASRKLGYMRLGEALARAAKAVPGPGCAEGWYAVAPFGHVCAGEDATTDLGHRTIRALGVKPDLSKPMPYTYGFVRANSTLYHQVPTVADQERFEFAIKQYRKSYAKRHAEWNRVDKPGANHVPLDAAGNAKAAPKDLPPPPPPPDPENLFGLLEDGETPWWLRGRRQLPNLSSFKAPEHGVFMGRIQRHAGLAIVGSFKGDEKAGGRRFAVLLDGRIIGEDKIKPHYASAFHGVPVGGAYVFPFAMVKREGAPAYAPSPGANWPRAGELAYRDVIPLTGRVKWYASTRYLEAKDGRWLRHDDIAVFDTPSEPPKAFDWQKTKWVDVSIWQQTMVMYEGDKPVYATMVSTGIDGMGDPQTSKSTVRGEFRIDYKHVTATMDADDPENSFELRDVPWVQYFERGYALHAAYWHDDFGKPRSHGCINLAPVDARRLFFWTDPPLPTGWHGIKSGGPTTPGTWVRVRG